VKLERNASPSFLIVDAQSVKNSDTAGSKGYDAGKKVSGIKRHLAVDTQGLPHAVAITTADVSDRKGAKNQPGHPQLNPPRPCDTNAAIAASIWIVFNSLCHDLSSLGSALWRQRGSRHILSE
jgi:hypothetical protein